MHFKHSPSWALALPLLLATIACKRDEPSRPPPLPTSSAATVACGDGYETKDGKCVDVDECAAVATPCGPHPDAKCANRPGSYECTCAEGFSGGGPDGIGCAPAMTSFFTTVCTVYPDGGTQCWDLNGGKPKQIAYPPLQGLGPVALLVSRGGRSDGCALMKDGTVRCWGLNDKNQLGNGTLQASQESVQVPNIANAVALNAQGDHACVVHGNGRVSCWGNNQTGMLGRSTAAETDGAREVPGLRQVVALSGSVLLSCALQRTGTASCWGFRPFGRLSEPKESAVPLQLPMVKNAIQVAADYHGCSLRTDRTVWCWGENDYGQLGDGTQVYSDAARRAQIDNVAWLGVAREGTAFLRSGQVYRVGRDYLNHPGSDSEGYVSTEQERTLQPVSVGSTQSVRSISLDLRLVQQEGDRLALISDRLVYVINPEAVGEQ